MKNVLILAAKFPPTSAVGGIRSVKFAKYLPLFNWNPIVITPSESSKRVHDASLLSEVPSEVEIHRPYFFNYRKWMHGDVAKLFRPIEKKYIFPDKYIFWNPFAFRYIAKHILPYQSVDIIYASMGPHSTMLLSRKLKQHFGIPFVLDFRDPFSFYQYTVLNNRMDWRKRALDMEKSVFKEADHINIVTKTWRKKYETIFPEIKNKTSNIHNGYDEDDFISLPERTKNDRFTIGYNGTFSRLVPIDPLIRAIVDIHKSKNISITLSIATSTSILKIKQKYPYMFTHNLIDYKGFLEHKKSLMNLYEADVSALILNNINATEGQIPAKTFEYLRINNPIILLNKTDGQLAKIIADTNSGYALDIDDHQGILKLLMNLYQKWEYGSLEHQPNWEKIKRYERRTQTEQLSNIFNSIVSKI